MARGIQPTAQQHAEERSITLQATTDELVNQLDPREIELLDYLGRAVAGSPTLSRIVQTLKRGDAIENSDHVELFDAVREVAS